MSVARPEPLERDAPPLALYIADLGWNLHRVAILNDVPQRESWLHLAVDPHDWRLPYSR